MIARAYAGRVVSLGTSALASYIYLGMIQRIYASGWGTMQSNGQNGHPPETLCVAV